MLQYYLLIPLVIIAYVIGFLLLKQANQAARLKSRIEQIAGSMKSPSVTLTISPTDAEAKFLTALKKYELHDGWKIVSHQIGSLEVIANIQYTGSASKLDYYDNRFNTGRNNMSIISTNTKMTVEARISPEESGCRINWNFDTESRQLLTNELVTEDGQSEDIRLRTNECILKELDLLAGSAKSTSMSKL